MDTLYIVAPAYNEAENIRQFLADWYPVIERHGENGSRLLIVNDGSRDDTGKILEEAAGKLPLLVLINQENAGHGPTLMRAYQYALSQGVDYVFQTDTDGQTSPLEFESFWRKRHEYDAIFGRRVHRQDGLGRIFAERILCLLLRIYFQVSLPDANAPYRLMRADFLKESLALLPPRYRLPNVMLTVLAAKNKKCYRFIPIHFGARRRGNSSIGFQKLISSGLRSLKEFGELRKLFKKYNKLKKSP